jgi:hypothetical protein
VSGNGEHRFSSKLFGRELIIKLADKLWSGPNGSINKPHLQFHYDYGFAYRHRDYCGVGLAFVCGILKIQEVFDGYFMQGPNVKIFKEWNYEQQENFIDFMSVQSDYTLSGFDNASIFYEDRDFFRGNQRLSLQRITAFVAAKNLEEGWYI